MKAELMETVGDESTTAGDDVQMAAEDIASVTVVAVAQCNFFGVSLYSVDGSDIHHT
jgi:hypothetical protein